jgi:glycosyltransferase involved in cell wall biosynthesis
MDSTNHFIPGKKERRLKVAIVSTYDELCGIAGYTRALERQLRAYANVEVLDLDQFLLRTSNKHVQKLGDKLVKDFAARLHEFDSVNIQLEHGTLGKMPWQIMRRFKWLADAAPCLSVTFHTILNTEPFPSEAYFRLMGRGKLIAAQRLAADYMRGTLLSRGVYSHLRKLQKRKPVRIIVHSRRDARAMQLVERIGEVFHHPLAFVEPKHAAYIRSTVTRNDFPILRDLPADAKLIGTFGFLSPYKGFETAIQSLRYLPDNYHLLVFGGIHPQTIKKHQPLDPYIAQLLKTARIGQNVLDDISEAGNKVSLTSNVEELLQHHPADLNSRIHFMGVLDDEGFMAAMSVCDCVALPYVEVGQTSSGPVSIALEMDCRIIASRTGAFQRFGRYHPDQIEYFDIGNFAELAERIKAEPSSDPRQRKLAYNTETNCQVYIKANTPPGNDDLIRAASIQEALA